MRKYALGIIDAQRSFMPAEEGQRLQLAGFGEMPIRNGQEIIPPIQDMIAAYRSWGYPIFTTQDWHQAATNHFSSEPNYDTTWPRHCIAGTPGAELHPEIDQETGITRFYKGVKRVIHTDEDAGSTALSAVEPRSNQSLLTWLHRNRITNVTLAGLAFDTCVGKTAIALGHEISAFAKSQGGDVAVINDATRSLCELSAARMVGALRVYGVLLNSSEQHISQLSAASQ